MLVQEEISGQLRACRFGSGYADSQEHVGSVKRIRGQPRAGRFGKGYADSQEHVGSGKDTRTAKSMLVWEGICGQPRECWFRKR